MPDPRRLGLCGVKLVDIWYILDLLAGLYFESIFGEWVHVFHRQTEMHKVGEPDFSFRTVQPHAFLLGIYLIFHFCVLGNADLLIDLLVGVLLLGFGKSELCQFSSSDFLLADPAQYFESVEFGAVEYGRVGRVEQIVPQKHHELILLHLLDENSTIFAVAVLEGVVVVRVIPCEVAIHAVLIFVADYGLHQRLVIIAVRELNGQEYFFTEHGVVGFQFQLQQGFVYLLQFPFVEFYDFLSRLLLVLLLITPFCIVDELLIQFRGKLSPQSLVFQLKPVGSFESILYLVHQGRYLEIQNFQGSFEPEAIIFDTVVHVK